MPDAIEVAILLPAALRPTAGGAVEVRVAADTVDDALVALIAAHPRLRRHLFMDTGRLRGYVNVFVNETELRALANGGATALEPGDVITILPSIAGG